MTLHMSQEALRLSAPLGVGYAHILVTVPATEAPSLRDAAGHVVPLQRVPAMPMDRTDDAVVTLALVHLAPGDELRLTPAKDAVPTTITVTPDGPDVIIRNGRAAVRVPGSGLLEQPFPGPILALQCDGGAWFGHSTIVDVPYRGAVDTHVEALGPCCVQWRTTYRWGNDACFTVRIRWAAGSDTLQVVETVHESGDGAVEWYPFGDAPARGWWRGERQGVMQPLTYTGAADARRGVGRRRLNSLSHISYFNQWNLAWVGFVADDDPRFVGIFSGWGGLWDKRGDMRPDILEDDVRGHLVRFPLQAGRRLYGIVITDKALADMDVTAPPCLLNRRKTQLSDLALGKVLMWVVDPPLEAPTPHLVAPDALETFRARLAADADIQRVLVEVWGSEASRTGMPFAMALWADDASGMQQYVAPLLAFARHVAEQIGAGGYETLSIFDARTAKSHAYDLDILWARGLISEGDYRTVRRALLALAYMIADPDFMRCADFWPHTEPDAGMVQALQNDMGDCPVPPNFAAEFIATTGVVAELFPAHPLRETWRQWAQVQVEGFLATYFTPDGTYLESINYHQHMFNELLMYLYPAALHGVRDYFADPRIRGSFAHFVRIQTPPLAERVPGCDGPVLRDHWQRWCAMTPDWQAPHRAVLPANGNSGGEGFEQPYTAELCLGMAIYRDRDPQLAGELATAWARAGRPFLDAVHPTLTLLTLDPCVPARAVPRESVWRQSLGLFSRAQQGASPVWCLFRAGSTTHHMCYDQGNLHLMLGDRVLLGEYGYHAHDQHGNTLWCHETWLHNTVVYAENKHLSSGYTGLERAPEPTLVYTSAAFDWAVHRIVNTNFRDCSRYWYNVMLPDPTTVHVRHYLFVKPDYFLLWDTFEAAHQPSLYFLHPHQAPRAIAPGHYRTGEAGHPHLGIQFLQPTAPEIVEDAQLGPFWSFAVRNATGQPYLTLLVPQVEERHITAVLEDARTIRVHGRGVDDSIRLPAAGSRDLPDVRRGGASSSKEDRHESE